jgi:hypothetical protein
VAGQKAGWASTWRPDRAAERPTWPRRCARAGRAGAWSPREGRHSGAVAEGPVVASRRQGVADELVGTTGRVPGNRSGGNVGRRAAHRWAEFGRCGRGATTRQRRRKGARDGDLAGVRQLVDWLCCEECGRHDMVVADSDEEWWAQTGADGCSGELELGDGIDDSAGGARVARVRHQLGEARGSGKGELGQLSDVSMGGVKEKEATV